MEPEETSVDGGDEEGDNLENNGKGPLSISTTATGHVCETNRWIYSLSEMEDLRFLDIDAQRRMWNAVYAGMESDVVREYSKLWVPDDQKKGNHENLVWDKFVRKKDDFGENDGKGALSISTTATGRVCETNRRIYSRSEMEDLRFLDVDAQRRMWNAVYAGMESDVAREYSKLWVPDDQKKGNHENLVWDKFVRKKDDFGAVGEVFSFNMMESGIFFSSDNAYGKTLVGSENYTINEVSFCEENNVVEFEIDDVDDDDSDDEYESIQRPAFLVEGEPDFDSGPPLDGLEYLRRVRWEAAHIPKVKVAQLNLTKVCGQQTPYMPIIPGIKECPLNLLPSKHWEDGFLADFSKLRQAFSDFENSRTTNESPKPSACRQMPRGDPTLTAILAMDASSRASILRSSISSFDASSTISRTDCLWLFALSATVDAPLNVDTCASMRCLLRKCSSLLAAKSRVDDEVSMLSILIAIAGKYFGQSEKR